MNENRRFQESYLRLKTLHWRHACLPQLGLASPAIAVVEDWDGLAGWLAGCLSCWGPLIMDLFEWIKTRPWLYKYPQIMCPIIVVASSKQRSSRWLQHGYFYTSRHLMSASKWALHVEGLDLTAASKQRTRCYVTSLCNKGGAKLQHLTLTPLSSFQPVPATLAVTPGWSADCMWVA